ncbi:MAG: Asp-tRNA(Asn)/Glu-tRNA(Gln) amidotransferase subunit GatC [Cryomorphaceae bacterium]|jgi:aspartyl-tRNA(Asn)/glutamyl-tRNA(Gln) amidotransferase subunit C|nr:Asp-tRNA(Asn)/Glu-tRNA(Gln) amidotransferase subunit GatC [Cryomorphaceae bacterium]MBT4214972.1 Asp-tRNA(Asn)/Glu-tRNA(Gln) amidotransferase subunit GatC [Bacteroidota bacterium]MCH1406149.1 Asp-tRNA(Asn)/Glu-tRNA(Gln) amidotransferase subunit GatC [Schleiferiaceae bacterium]MCO4775440.1 Asp-tRNA(Asn)/Glu-tRNA(Gln) amidotransferase subunit GatC [Flavobacteriales bacterium]MDB9838421.1 Asp-tRNA(Asn)/Glu-tRNA(Gln) amidotransferase subunit GatC [bacterium]
MEISKEQIKHLAHLSRLELSEAEIDAMQGDMSKILDFVAQVEKLDLEGVEPLTQMSKSVNVMRQDEVANMISKEDALKNAPDANSDYFRVSKFGKKV